MNLITNFKYGNGLTAKQIGAMAAAAGICIANIYYNQPIRVAESNIGLVAVLTQCGFDWACFSLSRWGIKSIVKN